MTKLIPFKTFKQFIAEREADEAYYHGSPHGGLHNDFSNFRGTHAYLTKDHKVAHHYASTPTMGAQRGEHDGKRSVYHVHVDKGHTFDMRKGEHQELYDKVRKEHNSKHEDSDEHLPSRKSSGFIQKSGLPSFGHATEIMHHVAKHGFHSMHVDEGSQGHSLLLHHPQKRVKVHKVEQAT